MESAYFVVTKGAPGGTFQTVSGPFETEEVAIETSRKMFSPGTYLVYGPCKAVYSTTISAPQVEGSRLT